MKNIWLSGLASLVLASISFTASAIPTSADWEKAGDGLITRDTTNGLEWLDFSRTLGRSYTDISSKFGVEQEFEGWRYATTAELAALWDSFEGASPYNGWSTANNGLFDVISPLMGDLYCIEECAAPGDGYTYILTGEILGNENVRVALMSDDIFDSRSMDEDGFYTAFGAVAQSFADPYFGSALVRQIAQASEPGIVPLVATSLLFMMIVRRKKSNSLLTN